MIRKKLLKKLKMKNIIRLSSGCLAVSLFSGCGSFVAPAYSPNYETIDRLKKVPLEKITIAEVQPRDAKAPVNQITLRGSSLSSPNGSFSNYLENAIRSDLIEMGIFDPAATTRLGVTLLKNDIDVSSFSTGTGVMEINLSVSKNNVVLFEKAYSTTIQFESSFAGAVAIPKGQSEYPNLVRALLQKIYTDPSFVASIKK